MKRMTGEIGKLSVNGDQVGGFKYWTAIVQKKPPRSRVIASQFWMFKQVEGELTASFFYNLGDDLKLVLEKAVTIEFPEHELDTAINRPLVMEFEEGFNWLS